MKTKVILAAILSLGILFTSCNDDDLHLVPSDKITSKTISVSGISQLDVSDLFNVQVTFSETEESVVVESNENIHQIINIKQDGETLNIGLDENSTISGTPVLNVYIKTASIEKVQAAGASKIEFKNPLLGSILEIDLEGACLFTGEIQVDELFSNLLGASVMNISGEANVFEIDGEGASKMTGFEFTCDDLKAVLYGASDISLTVNEKLDVTASGASNVYYKGNGVIEKQNLSDTSKITKLD